MHTLTVVILTLNERENLGKAVASVGERAPVVVLDSGSTDGTQALASELGCELHTRAFDDYAKQRQHALGLVEARTRWVFFLDADEEIPEALWPELLAACEDDELDGAYVGLTFRVLGRDLRHGVFGGASILRLMRPTKAVFRRGSNERVDDRELRTTRLRTRLLHNDAKPLAQWFAKHLGYARREAAHYLAREQGEARPDWSRLRTKAGRVAWMRWSYNRLPLFVRPWIRFARAVLLGSAWRDGVAGLLYAGMQSLWYPLVTDLLIFEARARGWTPEQVMAAGTTQVPSPLAQANADTDRAA